MRRPVNSRAWPLLLFASLAGCESLTATKAPKAMYTSTEGNYRVLLPANPTEKTSNQTFSGITLTQHMTMGGPANKLELGVIWVEQPTNSPANPLSKLGDRLDGAATQMVTNFRGTELSRNNISLDGHPGREVRFQVPATGKRSKLLGRIRLYSIGDRFYEVIAISAESLADPEASKEFFDSFVLINPVAVSAEASEASTSP